MAMHLAEDEAPGEAQEAEMGGIELVHMVRQEETGHVQLTGTRPLAVMESYL